MNTQLKKIALIVLCIAATGTAITAAANPIVTGLKAPAELFVGDVLNYDIEGTGRGLCEYHYDIGNGFAGYEKLPFPVKGSVIPQYKVAADENFHVYTMTITPLGNCKSMGGRSISASIKVKKVMDNSAGAPVIIPTVTPTKPGATLAPPLPTLTAIGISPDTAPAGKVIFRVDGTGYCKYHVTYARTEAPPVASPNMPFESSAQSKFPMTLTFSKPSADKPGTYTYTAVGYDGCTGSANSPAIIVK